MKTTVLGVAYDNISMAEALARGRELLAGSETAYCVTPNAEMAYEAMHDSEFCSILNGAALVLPAGAGVILGAKIVRTPLKEKVAGIAHGLERFGVEYDRWFSEQSLHDAGDVAEVVDILRDKGYVYEKDGAHWLKCTAWGEEKDEVLIRSNGTPTYFAADIAYHRNKFERGYNKLINIWGADHHGHVARLKGAMTALGYPGDHITVILMQLVRLYRGGELVKMSKRKGQFVTLEELIDEVGK